MNVEEIIDSETKVFGLRYWDDPVLSMVCEPVRDSEFGSKLEVFASRMIATMDSYNGVGLAAAQVGVPIRLFIMHFPENRRYGNLPQSPLAVCNPTLELTGETVFGQEGCLSLPTIYSQVARSKNAIMRYFTVLGEEREMELHDMDARVAQHEYDHTMGIMFIDRLNSRQMRKSVLRQWEKQKEKIFSKN